MSTAAPVGTQFTALIDFDSVELRSGYSARLSYTVRAGDDKLAELVPRWLAEGKVRLGGPAGGVVQGKG